jgi:hypothetical protein
MMLMTYKKSSAVQAIKITHIALCLDKAISNIATGVQAPPRQLLLHRLGNRSLRRLKRLLLVLYLLHPCSRKAPIFGACTCRQSLRSGSQQLPYLTTA